MFDRTEKGLWWDAAARLNSGCTKVSPGCDHCWAESELKIRSNSTNPKIAAQWPGDFCGDVRLLPDNIEKILKARTPRAWSVWNDLFHKSVPFWYIAKVFYTAAISYRHVVMALTKRPERAVEFLEWVKEKSKGMWWGEFGQLASHLPIDENQEIGDPWLTYHTAAKKHYYPDIPEPVDKLGDAGIFVPWPVPNIWLGTSAEDQQRLDERAGHLLRCQASLLFLSLEPLLGPMRIHPHLERVEAVACPLAESLDGVCRRRGYTGRCPNQPEQTCGLCCNSGLGVNWVIVGAESRGARIGRECRIEWVRSIIEQCKAANVPVFVKQIHIGGKLVKDIKKFPEDLRLRQVPGFNQESR